MSRKIIEMDSEAFASLKADVYSALICLNGINSRMKKELEAIGIARSLTNNAYERIERLVPTESDEEE
jgi:hypothetical protein